MQNAVERLPRQRPPNACAPPTLLASRRLTDAGAAGTGATTDQRQPIPDVLISEVTSLVMRALVEARLGHPVLLEEVPSTGPGEEVCADCAQLADDAEARVADSIGKRSRAPRTE